jgi:hypothetical protein
MSSAGFEFNQSAFDAFDHRATLTGARGLAQSWTGPVFAQTGFDTLEVLDLPHEPARCPGRGLNDFVKFSTDIINTLVDASIEFIFSFNISMFPISDFITQLVC